jgi:hypothetical protein
MVIIELIDMQEIFFTFGLGIQSGLRVVSLYYQRFTVKSRVATRAEACKSKGENPLSRPRSRGR